MDANKNITLLIADDEAASWNPLMTSYLIVNTGLMGMIWRTSEVYGKS